MQVLTSPEAFDRSLGRPVITVGSFDGLHQGHQRIIRYVVDRANQARVPSVVYTFSPHPYFVVKGVSGRFLISTDQEKLAILEQLGVAMVIVQPFTAAFASIRSEEFIAMHLVGHLAPQRMVVGYSHVFGKDAEGSETLLKELGRENGFAVDVVDAIQLQNEKINSTAVRNYLARGAVDRARFMLGRPYTLSGTVVRGEGRGRTLGMPTLNVVPDSDRKIIPADGIYIGRTRHQGESFPSLVYCGKKPTFGTGNGGAVEVHLLNMERDLYDAVVTVEFLTRIRDDRAFSSPDDLKIQLAADREVALHFFHQENPHAKP
jgi:riboflavin kinase/FMN adenylyltransferase